MKYLLDANAVIALLNNGSNKLAERTRSQPPADIAISAIVAHELFYGAFRSKRLEQNLARINDLQFAVIEFDKEDAKEAAEIRAALAAKGTPIGPYDILIAGQAKSRDLTLITRNTSEFGRIKGLKIQDWEK